MAELKEFLEKRERQGLLRTLNPLSFRRESNFSSNDYLGLAGHPKMIQAARSAVEQFGTGSSASRLMTGDSELYHQLEEKVARFKDKEASLVFNSGYQANVGILSALYSKGDAVFCDRLSHASIIDGILLSGARFFRFQHNDAGHLESLLKSQRHKFKKALIVTETIFSMEGDWAPLKELTRLKEKYSCALMVDEAHATGIFGKNGAGVVEEEGLQEKVDLVMGTFSKALGSFGAYLAASREVIAYLVNTCRSFIYSTALPPAVIASNIVALELVKEEPYRREKLLALSRYFRETLGARGLDITGSSQIVPVIVGENLKAQEKAAELQAKGYWVLPIRPPTVPDGQARLRFSLTFYHDKEILERLIHDICESAV